MPSDPNNKSVLNAKQPARIQPDLPGANFGVPERSGLRVAAPRDYFLGPVFAASKQKGPREVTVGNRRYLIGGFHPIHPTRIPPALDIRHARAIFALLSFRDVCQPNHLIRFSFNEFCRRYASSNGGRYARDIKAILGDLMDTYLKVTDATTNISHSYRFIEKVDIEERPIRRSDDRRSINPQQELWFNGATLSEAFFELLGRIVELQHLKLDVFTSIRSPLAQAIYLYIPSRAAHHSRRNPFEIKLATLLEQVSHPVPQTRKLRKKLFTQNRTSIIAQLNGKETLTGTFRVHLADSVDGSDWKLQAWVEPTAVPKRRHTFDSKMTMAFLQSGRTEDELRKRLEQIEPLDSYESELLAKAEVTIDGNQRFFELAKALLRRNRFQTLLAEAKGDALEGIQATKTPTARLIFRIMESLKTPSPPPQQAAKHPAYEQSNCLDI